MAIDASPPRPVLVANMSGFLGDRLSAPREMVEGGSIDILTGDYLAELTMFILWKAKQRDPSSGYCRTFLSQMEDVLGSCLDAGIRVVTNAGGLNPSGLASALADVAAAVGLHPQIAYIEGDDVLDSLAYMQSDGYEFRNIDTGHALSEADFTPAAANAYLGAWGIVRALEADADVVICPRVTDASLVVGPAAWWHGWKRDDWNALAGAVVAGHIIECGPQATGGNYSMYQEISDWRYPGYPIAQIEHDGSSTITKHVDTGGLVSVGTVTEQLLYEIGSTEYLNPDVTTYFDSIELAAAGEDRVRVTGVRGDRPTPSLKLGINGLGGYRNSMTFVITGLDVEVKADWAVRVLFELLGGREQFDDIDVRLLRTDRPDAATNEGATARLRVTVKSHDMKTVGRSFSNAAMGLLLATFPGCHTDTPPQEPVLFSEFWPTLIPKADVQQVVVLPDGSRSVIEHTEGVSREGASEIVKEYGPAVIDAGSSRKVPLGSVYGARSGDKGGNANLGVWARSDDAYAWLFHSLTPERLRTMVPEFEGLEIRRYEFPNLHAVNFVILGLLGTGVSSTARPDPQAKGLAEYLRSKCVQLPAQLVDGQQGGSSRGTHSA